MRNYSRTQKQPQISNTKCIIFQSLISFFSEEISHHDIKETGIDGSLTATGLTAEKKKSEKKGYSPNNDGRKKREKEGGKDTTERLN